MKRFSLCATLLFAALSIAAEADAVLLGSAGPNADQLISIDPVTGAGTLIGSIGFVTPGLAFDSNSEILYGLESAPEDRLHTIDPDTGTPTVVGDTGLSTTVPSGLAFDPETGTLFVTATTGISADLYTLNTSTGAATLVGPTGITGLLMRLAFDPMTDTLFGAHFNNLYELNATTGAATLIGPIGFSNLGLTFDTSTNTLYGTDLDTDQLLSINPMTGAGTVVGPIGYFVSDLAFIPDAEPSADFDGNDIVDGRDFLKWQRGMSPNPFSQSDLALWESQYGGPPPLSALAAVPEPCALLLGAWACLGALTGRARLTTQCSLSPGA